MNNQQLITGEGAGYEQAILQIMHSLTRGTDGAIVRFCPVLKDATNSRNTARYHEGNRTSGRAALAGGFHPLTRKIGIHRKRMRRGRIYKRRCHLFTLDPKLVDYTAGRLKPMKLKAVTDKLIDRLTA